MPPSQLLLAFICIYESMYRDGKGKDLLMVFLGLPMHLYMQECPRSIKML